MEKKSIFSEIENLAKAEWLSGKFEVPYNLRWIVWLLAIPVLLIMLILWLLKQIWRGMVWILAKVWDGLCWLGKHLWVLLLLAVPFIVRFWNWLCEKFSAFWKWLCGLFHREPREKKTEEKKEKNWWWLLLLLLLLLLLGLFKACGGKEETTPEPEEIEYVTPVQAWDDVVYYRVHLDTLCHDARLIGLKNRGLKRATEAEYHGDALSESEAVVRNEWTTLVNEQVHVDLNRHQMAATILYAMRSGCYGFKKSDFLKSLNEGNFSKASEDILKLHKANGTIRINGKEATRYLYELRLIFEGGLSVEEVLDCHRWSYLLYPLDKGYQAESLKQVILTKGIQNATVRELLEQK